MNLTTQTSIFELAALVFGSSGIWAFFTAMYTKRVSKKTCTLENHKKIEESQRIVLHDLVYRRGEEIMKMDKPDLNLLRNFDYIYHSYHDDYDGNGLGEVMYESVMGKYPELFEMIREETRRN